MRAVLGPPSGSPEDTFRARADIVNAKVADISFVVDWLEELAAQPAGSDRLAGRLDLARLGCFGHSMGVMRPWSTTGWTRGRVPRPIWTAPIGARSVGSVSRGRCFFSSPITRALPLFRR